MNRVDPGLLIIIIISPFPLNVPITRECIYICMFQIKMMPFYNLHDVFSQKHYTSAGLVRII